MARDAWCTSGVLCSSLTSKPTLGNKLLRTAQHSTAQHVSGHRGTGKLTIL